MILRSPRLTDAELPKPPDDPRIFVSTEGLAIVYTVRQQKQQFVHHCSVSVAGGYTAHAVGGAFVAFMTKLVGLPWDKMSYEIGTSTVHHGELVVGPDEHEAIASQNVTRFGCRPSRYSASARKVAT